MEASESKASLSLQAGNRNSSPSWSWASSSSDGSLCSICSKVRPDDKLEIKFEKPVGMCGKCDFVNEIAKSCISAGILTKSGTSHDIRWRIIDKPDEWAIYWGVDEEHTKDEFILRETNFWDDFDWFVWTKGEGGSSGRSGCKFEVFIPPGKLSY
jgi:hypothetical protein